MNSWNVYVIDRKGVELVNEDSPMDIFEAEELCGLLQSECLCCILPVGEIPKGFKALRYRAGKAGKPNKAKRREGQPTIIRIHQA